MKANKVTAGDEALLDLNASVWSTTETTGFDMVATPLAMVEELSPFLARSDGHGAIKRLSVAAIHNDRMLAIRLAWRCGKHDTLVDLNTFVDGVAVLFPLTKNAIATTMGAKGDPVNAWYWKANAEHPREVMAEGFRSVVRLSDKTVSDLRTAARYADGEWNVIFRRSLKAGKELVHLTSGGATRVAFAAWSGGNAERSGRKSYSGEFVDLKLTK